MSRRRASDCPLVRASQFGRVVHQRHGEGDDQQNRGRYEQADGAGKLLDGIHTQRALGRWCVSI